ncbi:general stress protein, partial [Bacillus inaquosorum]|nr:general stress protein [Bacillus inaquosorum]
RDWLESLNFIEYTDKNDVEELERMIDRLLQVEPNEVDLSKDFQPLVDFFAS